VAGAVVVLGDAAGEAGAEGADDGTGPGAAVQDAKATAAEAAARRGKVLLGLSRRCWNKAINTMLPLH
jgi:hypothetical protein